MARFVLDFHFWQIDELIQVYLAVSIHIEGIERRVEDVKGKLMIGLDEFEVITKLFPCDFFIIILIVSMLEEELDILIGDFGVSMEDNKNKRSV